LRLPRRARKQTKSFYFVFTKINRRLTHTLCNRTLSRLYCQAPSCLESSSGSVVGVWQA
jgi:hypothetical protein